MLLYNFATITERGFDYMKINEVSKIYNISADTLRYYERIGMIPTVHRNESGIRDYTETDCSSVEFVICLRSAGVSVESIIEYMVLFHQGEHTRGARKAILIEEREKLLNRMETMQKTLERLNHKIDTYYKWVDAADDSLSNMKKVK